MKKSFAILVVLFLSASLVTINAQAKVQRAICTLNPTQGSTVSGTVTFALEDEGVRIVADVQGLTKGKHGIHIHEFGDCSSPDGSSAGNHFNPHSKNHGAPDAENRHSGDMGNIEVDESGKGRLEYVDKTMTLEGNGSVVGKSVIVHANEDDLKTQPSGNAGGRLACGVIEAL
ncbi:MAG TPA: superoxide dismutase family protein [Bacteroidales bacterium]|jgi:Cu-Zn family superoxide dismutase|nr:superoxide dismutase family protein [Bacteroidales bacterium]